MGILVRKQPNGAAYRLAGESSEAVLHANRFLDAVALRGLSSSTVRAYAFDLAWLVGWLQRCGKRVGDLDQAALLDFVAAQRERGAQPSSINRRLTVAALFYRFTTGCELPRGLYAAVPGPHYRGRGREHDLGLHAIAPQRRPRLRVRAPQRLVEPLSAAQVTSFLECVRRYRDLAIVYLMLFCGLRSGEVLALRLGDLDATEGRVRVRGKGNKERVLPLPASLPPIVADYLRLERPANAASDRLFVVLQGSRRGRAMTPAGLRSLFRQRRAATADLRKANAHRFRHTFGTDMARAGVRLAVLQRMMGHADAKTTLHYINLSMADVAAEFAQASAAIEKHYEQRR